MAYIINTDKKHTISEYKTLVPVYRDIRFRRLADAIMFKKYVLGTPLDTQYLLDRCPYNWDKFYRKTKSIYTMEARNKAYIEMLDYWFKKSYFDTNEYKSISSHKDNIRYHKEKALSYLIQFNEWYRQYSREDDMWNPGMASGYIIKFSQFDENRFGDDVIIKAKEFLKSYEININKMKEDIEKSESLFSTIDNYFCNLAQRRYWKNQNALRKRYKSFYMVVDNYSNNSDNMPYFKEVDITKLTPDNILFKNDISNIMIYHKNKIHRVTNIIDCGDYMRLYSSDGIASTNLSLIFMDPYFDGNPRKYPNKTFINDDEI